MVTNHWNWPRQWNSVTTNWLGVFPRILCEPPAIHGISEKRVPYRFTAPLTTHPLGPRKISPSMQSCSYEGGHVIPFLSATFFDNTCARLVQLKRKIRLTPVASFRDGGARAITYFRFRINFAKVFDGKRKTRSRQVGDCLACLLFPCFPSGVWRHLS